VLDTVRLVQVRNNPPCSIHDFARGVEACPQRDELQHMNRGDGHRTVPNSRGRQYLAMTCCLLMCMDIVGFSSRACAQTANPEPIRVQSNEILVPVVVLDKSHVQQIHDMDAATFVSNALTQGSRFLQEAAVRDLSAKDFQVFEDGKEQKVEGVNNNFVSAFDGSSAAGEGPTNLKPSGTAHDLQIPVLNWPGYIIAYVPPPSPEGSCHQVVVKVVRLDSLVYARPEYCNTRHAVNDTLRGTQFGKELEADLGSGKPDNLRVSVIVFSGFGDGINPYRSNVIVESPQKPRSCAKQSKNGVLGILYTDTGAIAARFSGRVSPDLSSDGKSLRLVVPSGDESCVETGPYVYGTSLSLTPGHYVLQVVLGDGDKFGHAELPMSLDDYPEQALGLSEIVVAKSYRQVSDSSEDGNALPLGTYAPLVSRGFEVLPTLDRRFKKGEPLDFYFQIYDPQQAKAVPARQVEARMRIVDSKTGRVVKTLQPVAAAPYGKPGNTVIPIGGGIDVSSLPAGSYMLETQAADSGGETTPWRSTSFTIVR
jgi:hypothetical protein